MTMSASVAVPSVAHLPSKAGLAEKVTIRDLNFFHGRAQCEYRV